MYQITGKKLKETTTLRLTGVVKVFRNKRFTGQLRVSQDEPTKAYLTYAKPDGSDIGDYDDNKKTLDVILDKARIYCGKNGLKLWSY